MTLGSREKFWVEIQTWSSIYLEAMRMNKIMKEVGIIVLGATLH